MCLKGGMPKTNAFSLWLSRGIAHATSECQTEVRENAVSKYHFPYPNCIQFYCMPRTWSLL